LIIKDTLLVVLSDLHSGGSTALTPGKFWRFDTERNHTPGKVELEMFELFKRCAAYVKKQRKDKRVIVVHNGDAIEGYHHNTTQVLTVNFLEQCRIHEDLMDTFLKGAGFDRRKGDALYYVNGTETHTGNFEREIARNMGAVPMGEDREVWDFLDLNVNGKSIWFYHHGKTRGRGPNEGNAIRNYLRDTYYNQKNRGLCVPDVLITSHTHGHTYVPFAVRDGRKFHVMHAIVTPSWQRKTRFGHKVAAADPNEIGATVLYISAAGDIRTPPHFETEIYE
jgi:hypothetical protein